MANRQGGRDNITALVVRADDPDEKADTEVMGKFNVLRQVPMFEHLTYKELIYLLNAAKVKFYEAGESVICEGDEDTRLFVILSGSVRIEKQGQVLAELNPVDFFGEMSLIDKSPRSADVVATEYCRMFVIDRNNMFDLLNSEPRLATKLLWPMCRVLNQRLRQTSADLAWAQVAAADGEEDDGEPIDALGGMTDG